MNSSEREIRRQYHHSCREDRSFPMTLREYRTAVVHEKEEWSGAVDWKGACIMVYKDNSTDTENMNVIDVEPLPSDPTSDEWMEDGRRIMDENKREKKHHWDAMRHYGGIEQFLVETTDRSEQVVEYFG